MSTVNVRDLRNHGGDVLDRVMAGEVIIVTRSGQEVAELRPLRRHGLSAEELVRRWKNVPSVDPVALRADIDAI
ncbi:MAG TPA: type II toxin-antitoxin system prevent-host-death family antitoxin, partial [Galbitalea sp.]|nr:type II toxin-antitoxin system prevent-host-death family antitoxin [Galbitalea sp.]